MPGDRVQARRQAAGHYEKCCVGRLYAAKSPLGAGERAGVVRQSGALRIAEGLFALPHDRERSDGAVGCSWHADAECAGSEVERGNSDGLRVIRRFCAAAGRKHGRDGHPAAGVRRADGPFDEHEGVWRRSRQCLRSCWSWDRTSRRCALQHRDVRGYFVV
ncbi:hypothetical protein D3C77_465290 [compost metagenome]